jgi:uncharacterized protein (DUF433 family)
VAQDLEFEPARAHALVVNWRDFITFEAGKRSGKPCIRGMRITAYDVLEYLAGGMTPDEIVSDFPELTHDDIRAVLAFAADRERRAAGVAAE